MFFNFPCIVDFPPLQYWIPATFWKVRSISRPTKGETHGNRFLLCTHRQHSWLDPHPLWVALTLWMQTSQSSSSWIGLIAHHNSLASKASLPLYGRYTLTSHAAGQDSDHLSLIPWTPSNIGSLAVFNWELAVFWTRELECPRIFSFSHLTWCEKK